MNWNCENGIYRASQGKWEWEVTRVEKGFKLIQYEDSVKIGPTYNYRGNDVDTILGIANGKANAL